MIETPSVTFTSFLSEIGGQLGLWIGASIFTITQLILMCFHLASNGITAAYRALKVGNDTVDDNRSEIEPGGIAPPRHCRNHILVRFQVALERMLARYRALKREGTSKPNDTMNDNRSEIDFEPAVGRRSRRRRILTFGRRHRRVKRETTVETAVQNISVMEMMEPCLLNNDHIV